MHVIKYFNITLASLLLTVPVHLTDILFKPNQSLSPKYTCVFLPTRIYFGSRNAEGSPHVSQFCFETVQFNKYL